MPRGSPPGYAGRPMVFALARASVLAIARVSVFVTVLVCALVSVLVSVLAAGPTAAADSLSSLGGAPVCEASTILRVPCHTGAADCWLVGDNEVRTQLFLYGMADDGRPDTASREAVVISPVLAPEDEISDIEALARFADGEVLVYGSHSRNKDCKVRPNRRRYVGLRLERENGAIVARPGRIGFVSSGKTIDWARVFGGSPQGDSPQGELARVLRAVSEGDARADTGDCSASFDIEGAVVSHPEGVEHVWLGLRAPLVDGYAVLVRHDVDAGGLRFSEARLLDLGGAGVRGLARGRSRGKNWIYGLSAAPGGRESDRFALWRFPEAVLSDPAPAGPVAVEILAPVAARSEGVAAHQLRRPPPGDPGTAIVVQDGDEGAPCRRDATYQIVPIGR